LTLGSLFRGRKCAGEQEAERRAFNRKEESNLKAQLILLWGHS